MKSPAAQAAPDPPSQPLLVEIEKPIYGGAFLARIEGKTVFVPLALPGERARVRIVQEKRGYATAETEEIVTPSPERIAPACRHFGACGGCHYQHATYQAQLRFKEAILRETLSRGGVRAPDQIAVLSANPWAYRNRIRLAFDAAGNPGYRSRRSYAVPNNRGPQEAVSASWAGSDSSSSLGWHTIIPIAECPIAAPLLVQAAQAAVKTVRQFAPALRPTEISLFCDAAESALLASVFVSGPAKGRFQDFAQALSGQIPALRGAELVVEGRAGQPPRTIAQWGATSLVYQAAGFGYRVDHGAFFQVNRWLVDALVEQVARGPSGALAWDLFAGVGLFARRLTAGFDRVVAVESAPSATAALEQNLSGTDATAVKASTLDYLRRARGGRRADRIVPSLIVVDPPRTGLGAETAALLAEIGAPALTYVSCDPATLARDLRALIHKGYAIENLTLADLFPHTFHLETVVRLRRS
jgi:23S rRNA (uracil1939-C5)-methyltransferase